MTLPALTKTWQFNVNNAMPAQGSVLATNRRLLRTIKNALIGFASNPWTVRGSSNGVTAAATGDGVDRWAADSDLVFVNTSGNRSWIVLRQTGISGTFEILIDCAASGSTPTTNGYGLLLYTSVAGFTGGSVSARPTAADEISVGSSLASNWSLVQTDVSTRLSVMQSSDGACTRIFLFCAGVLNFMWIFDKPINTPSAWVNPSYALAGISTNVSTYASIYGSPPGARSRINSTTATMYMMTEGGAANQSNVLGPNDNTTGAIANELDGEWTLYPIALISITAPVRGRHATLPDMWIGCSGVAVGDTYPADGSNQFLHVGPLVVPWNGGPVNLT